MDLIGLLNLDIDAIASLFAALHALALAIVNLTETPKDDEWLGRIYRWIEFLAGIINSNKVKQ